MGSNARRRTRRERRHRRLYLPGESVDAADRRLRGPPGRRDLLRARRALGRVLRARPGPTHGRSDGAGLHLRDRRRELPPGGRRGGPVPRPATRADRRPARELSDSGANQTVDQTKLYGDAVRWYRELPEPAPDARRLRSLRVAADRAVAKTTGANPGPVHLNVPVAKPLEPVERPGDVPDSLAETAPLGSDGRDGPFVRTAGGTLTPDERAIDDVAAAADAAERGLIVAGPLNPGSATRTLSARSSARRAGRCSPIRCPGSATGRSRRTTSSAAATTPISAPRAGPIPISWSVSAPRPRRRPSGASCATRTPDRSWSTRRATGPKPSSRPPTTSRQIRRPSPRRSPRDWATARTRVGSGEWRDRFERAEAVHWNTVESGADERFFEERSSPRSSRKRPTRRPCSSRTACRSATATGSAAPDRRT